MHDVTVLDVAICIMKSLGIKAEDITTEKQLHQQKRFWRKNPSARHCIHKGQQNILRRSRVITESKSQIREKY